MKYSKAVNLVGFFQDTDDDRFRATGGFYVGGDNSVIAEEAMSLATMVDGSLGIALFFDNQDDMIVTKNFIFSLSRDYNVSPIRNLKPYKSFIELEKYGIIIR